MDRAPVAITTRRALEREDHAKAIARGLAEYIVLELRKLASRREPDDVLTIRFDAHLDGRVL